MKFKVVGICDSAALSVVPKESVRFDLDGCAKILESEGYDVENLGVMVITTRGGREITMFKNGRLMIHPVEDKEEAADIANRFYEAIERAKE